MKYWRSSGSSSPWNAFLHGVCASRELFLCWNTLLRIQRRNPLFYCRQLGVVVSRCLMQMNHLFLSQRCTELYGYCLVVSEHTLDDHVVLQNLKSIHYFFLLCGHFFACLICVMCFCKLSIIPRNGLSNHIFQWLRIRTNKRKVGERARTASERKRASSRPLNRQQATMKTSSDI